MCIRDRTYTVTQADLTAGSVTNIASGTAKHGANTVTSNTDTVTVPGVQTPTLALDKTTTTLDYDSVGDIINYSYKVTNSGNVPLTPPYAVSDNKTTVSCPQTPNPLLPGAFITCTATYTVTQADLDAGQVVNIASASAMFGQTPVTSNTDTVNVPALLGPELTLDKDTQTPDFDEVGDVIQYTYKAVSYTHLQVAGGHNRLVGHLGHFQQRRLDGRNGYRVVVADHRDLAVLGRAGGEVGHRAGVQVGLGLSLIHILSRGR